MTKYVYTPQWTPQMRKLGDGFQDYIEWCEKLEIVQPLLQFYQSTQKLNHLVQNSLSIGSLIISAENYGIDINELNEIEKKDKADNFLQLYRIIFKSNKWDVLILSWKTSHDHLIKMSLDVLEELKQKQSDDPDVQSFGEFCAAKLSSQKKEQSPNQETAGLVAAPATGPAALAEASGVAGVLAVLVDDKKPKTDLGKEVAQRLQDVTETIPTLGAPVFKLFFEPHLVTLYEHTKAIVDVILLLRSFQMITDNDQQDIENTGSMMKKKEMIYGHLFIEGDAKKLIRIWEATTNQKLIELTEKWLDEYTRKK